VSGAIIKSFLMRHTMENDDYRILFIKVFGESMGNAKDYIANCLCSVISRGYKMIDSRLAH